MRNQQGFLMVIAIVMTVLMALLSAALVQMFVTGNANSVITQSANKAFGLATAAIDTGAYQFSQNAYSCNSVFQATTSLSTGEFRYQCTPYTTWTQLNGAISTSSTAITVDSVASFASVGTLTIEDEVIYYHKTSGNQFQGLVRSAPASHGDNSFVYQTQYLLTGEGASPALSSPQGERTIYQALNFSNYLAVGASPYVFKNPNGAGWVTASGSISANINAISCISSTDCHAGGASGRLYRYNGSTWTLTATVSQTINGIHCLNSNFCKAVGNGGTFYSWNGSAWSQDSDAGITQNVLAVTCSSTSDCRAAGAATRFYAYNGSTWTLTTDLSPNVNVNSIACPASNDCWAVAAGGRAYRYTTGPNWVATSNIGSADLYAITCLSSSFCKAVGASGSFYTYNGTTWSADLTNFPTSGFTAAIVRSVSCANTQDCKAVGDGGRFYSYNAAGWGLTQDFSANITLNGIAAAPPNAMVFTIENIDPI